PTFTGENMKILLGCFRSSGLPNLLHSLGHEVMTCDIQEAEHSLPHYQGDLFDISQDPWDMLIACPPCQWLTKAQQYRFNQTDDYRNNTIEAVNFVRKIWNLPIPRIAIENPPGHLNKMWRYPSQLVRPYYFG